MRRFVLFLLAFALVPIVPLASSKDVSQDDGSYDFKRVVNVHEHLQSFELGENRMRAVMARTHQDAMFLLGSSDITFYLGRTEFNGWEANNQMIVGLDVKRPRQFHAFCTVDPTDSAHWSNFTRCLDRGALGIKLWIGHTYLQCGTLARQDGSEVEVSVFDKMGLMDERLMPVYDLARQRGLPIIYHVNPGPITPAKAFDLDTCTLKLREDFERLLDAHPDVTVLCPHLCLSKTEFALQMRSPNVRIYRLLPGQAPANDSAPAPPPDGEDEGESESEGESEPESRVPDRREVVWTADFRQQGPIKLDPGATFTVTFDPDSGTPSPAPPGDYQVIVEYGTDPKTGSLNAHDAFFGIGGGNGSATSWDQVEVSTSKLQYDVGEPVEIRIRNVGSTAIDPFEDSRLVRLLRDHPNVYTDLSFGFAGSPQDPTSLMREGLELVARYPAFFQTFLAEFQDRVMFGTDFVYTAAGYKTEDWYATGTLCYYDMLILDRYDCTMPGSFSATNLTGLALDEGLLDSVLFENADRVFRIGTHAPRTGIPGPDLGLMAVALLGVACRPRRRT